MPNSPSNLLVAISDQIAVVKFVGRATFSSSVQFKTLINELRARGHHHFILDLTECVTMDSTFLGVLAGFALKLVDAAAKENPFCLQLLNPNQRIADLLDNLGVGHLFQSVHGTQPEEARYDHVAADAVPAPTKRQISETCLEAHEVLMAVNPANVSKFKDVAQFLAEDLKK